MRGPQVDKSEDTFLISYVVFDLDLLDGEFWVTLRNAYAIPDEREYRVGEPVQPAQVPNLLPVCKMQVHLDVKEFVGAEAGNEIGFEPVCQQVLR